MNSTFRRQSTLARAVTVKGIGVFTGVEVNLTLLPALSSSGIVFIRTDLADRPEILASIDNVVKTPRCTVLGANGCFIQTVEHLLAALSACQIDNVIIEMDGPEVPILDGSALPFVEMIEEAGVVYQEEEVEIHYLEEPLYVSHDEVVLIALPSLDFRVTYTLSYPGHPLLEMQTHSFTLSREAFKKEIAPSRTFSLFEEITPLIERGIIKGGSLENGVVIKGEEILNPEGLRFKNEMVRHKILDLIGDLSLTRVPFYAHIIAIRSGHATNSELAKELSCYFQKEVVHG